MRARATIRYDGENCVLVSVRKYAVTRRRGDVPNPADALLGLALSQAMSPFRPPASFSLHREFADPLPAARQVRNHSAVVRKRIQGTVSMCKDAEPSSIV